MFLLPSSSEDCLQKWQARSRGGPAVPPWSRHTNLFKRTRPCRKRSRCRTCLRGLNWKVGQQVSPSGNPPPPYFIRMQFSLSNFFSPVNYIMGCSCLYTPIYADTVLYINCYIKTCQMGKKYNLAKLSD